MGPRQRFREMIESDGIIVALGVYDGVTAKLIESMGFETAAITGAGMSNS